MRFLRGFELLIMRQHGSELSDLHLQGMFEMQVFGKSVGHTIASQRPNQGKMPEAFPF